jgi:hypothetical protein
VRAADVAARAPRPAHDTDDGAGAAPDGAGNRAQRDGAGNPILNFRLAAVRVPRVWRRVAAEVRRTTLPARRHPWELSDLRLFRMHRTYFPHTHTPT